MIGLILYALIAVLIVVAVRRHLARRSPKVTVTAEAVTLGGEAVRLSDIRQINVARMPGGKSCVVLFGNSALTVDAGCRGFPEFAAAILARWPSVREDWQRVLNGPKDVTERATVWRQDDR